jgi:alginate O-acetyltransferase complex protein AlgI
MAVMLIGGLWHGASWNFVIWGGIHGAWLCLERILGKRSFYTGLPSAARVALTFLIVNLAWVFFRAKTLGDALTYVRCLFGLEASSPQALVMRVVLYSTDHWLTLALAATIAFFGTATWELAEKVTLARGVAALLLLVWTLAAMSAQAYSPFLYFQF